MKKHLNTQNLLWLALILAMAGSLKHLAHVFASVDDNIAFGWMQALAIDVGLFALTYSIKKRKADGRGTRFVWAGVALYSVISIIGNYIYGQVALGGELPGWIIWLKPIVLAASLPVLVIYLSEVVSDNQQFAKTPKPVAAPKKTSIAGKKTSMTDTDKRRKKVAALKADGKSNAEIARQLKKHINTISNDVKQLNGSG